MSPSLEQLSDGFRRLLAPAAGLSAAASALGGASEPCPGLGQVGQVGAAAPGGAAEPFPSPAPLPTGAVQAVDYSARGFHLEARVSPAQVVAAATLLDRHGFSLDTVTGVDWIAQGEMEVIYDFFHPAAGWRIAVRTRLPRGNADVPTISGIFPGANWHERETHEFLGIRFLGHPNLSPLLLPEDADYYPLRKDFGA